MLELDVDAPHGVTETLKLGAVLDVAPATLSVPLWNPLLGALLDVIAVGSDRNFAVTLRLCLFDTLAGRLYFGPLVCLAFPLKWAADVVRVVVAPVDADPAL